MTGTRGRSRVHQARHDLLLGDSRACGERLLPHVRAALDGGLQVLLGVAPRTRDHILEALGTPAGLHVGPPPGAGSRPAAFLADLVTLAELHGGSPDGRHEPAGSGIQVVDEHPHHADASWWEWSRVEAAHNLLLPGAWHLCAHDPETLGLHRSTDLRATHPWIDGEPNASYVDPTAFLRGRLAEPTAARLPEAWARLVDPDEDQVAELVRSFAASTDLGPDHVADLVFAAREVSADAHRHGTPPVEVSLWGGASRLTVAVTETGPGVGDPLAGLVPGAAGRGGTGLWLVHCMVDVRHQRGPGGSTVLLSVGTG